MRFSIVMVLSSISMLVCERVCYGNVALDEWDGVGCTIVEKEVDGTKNGMDYYGYKCYQVSWYIDCQ